MVVTLDCERKNITGSFDCSKAPVARIADGDSVVCNVLDGDWHLGKPPVPKTGAGSFFEGKAGRGALPDRTDLRRRREAGRYAGGQNQRVPDGQLGLEPRGLCG